MSLIALAVLCTEGENHMRKVQCTCVKKQAWRYLLTNQVWTCKWLGKPGSHSRRLRRLEYLLVISQRFPMLWRAQRHWKVCYQGWTDNSDVNKRLLLGTWIAHQAAWEKIKGCLQTQREKEPPNYAEVFQPHLDRDWKKGKFTSGQASIFWSKRMQATEEEREVQEDFDGWSTSCVFEEQNERDNRKFQS